MIMTGKIKKIERSVNTDWYTVILHKTRKGKGIDIPVFFGQKFKASIESACLYIGLKIDVTCFVYGKKNGNFWNSYVVCERWRPYVSGQIRKREIVSKATGEVVYLRGQF